MHPEIGLPELAANLDSEGISARQRDFNVELIYDELTRGSTLASFGCWLCQSADADELGGLRDEKSWRDLMVASACRRQLGPALDGLSLADFLARERQRTNRTARPRDRWLESKAPSLEEPSPGDCPHELKSAARVFVEHCSRSPGFWQTVVEALQYLFFAPATSKLSDVLARADGDLPLLGSFYAERLEELASDGSTPELFGVSLHARDQLLPALELLREVRRRWPDALLVAGGPWCSAARDLFAAAAPLFDHLDAVVIGKGLDPLMDLIERRLDGKDLDGIPGVCWRRKGEVELAAPRRGRALSHQSLPAFDGLPLELYPDQRVPVRLHDGCVWGRCRFCYHFSPGTHERNAPVVTGEHLDRVIAHVSELRRRSGIKRLTLLDHAVPLRTLRRFAARIEEAGLDVEWDAMARFEANITPAACAQLTRGGGREISLGVEAVEPEGLAFLHKGITLAQIEGGIEAYAAAGLRVRVFLLNYPGQGLDSLRRAVEWAVSRYPAVYDVNLGRFTLARGTLCWENREALGLVCTDEPETDPDLDVFQIDPGRALMIPFDEYEGVWNDSMQRFQALQRGGDGTPAEVETSPLEGADRLTAPDEILLRLVAPLVPGRSVRSWVVQPIDRTGPFPALVLRDPAARTLRFSFQPAGSASRLLVRSSVLDVVVETEPDGKEEQRIIAAVRTLIERNAARSS